MGLDMYITKEVYIGGKYEHNNVTGSIDLDINGIKYSPSINKIESIIEDVMYWRKANHIHYFLTKELEDDIKIEITLNDIKNLIETSKKVITSLENQEIVIKLDKNNKEYKEYKDIEIATKLMPPHKGFFFGSYFIDSWYLDDLRETVKVLEPFYQQEIKNKKDIDNKQTQLYITYKYIASY